MSSTTSVWRGSWPGAPPSAENGLGATYPAYNISWNDAKAFISTLNAHIVSSGQGPLTVGLPSETEWERAARGLTSERYPWGMDYYYTDIRTYAWFSGNNTPNGAKPVGTKAAHVANLLQDVNGNVWEWSEDDYHDNYTGISPFGDSWIDSPRSSNRVIRGGAWNSSAASCRSASRSTSSADTRDNAIGFRLRAGD